MRRGMCGPREVCSPDPGAAQTVSEFASDCAPGRNVSAPGGGVNVVSADAGTGGGVQIVGIESPTGGGVSTPVTTPVTGNFFPQLAHTPAVGEDCAPHPEQIMSTFLDQETLTRDYHRDQDENQTHFRGKSHRLGRL